MNIDGMSVESSSSIFIPGSVVWDLESREKEAAIRETILRSTPFHRAEGLDVVRFVSSVLAREREQSTGFGRGIAIAHGRDDAIPTSTVALGISQQGIEFDSFDGRPVHMLFIVGSHPDRQIDYLRILSSLAVLAHDDRFRHELMNCLGAKEAERTVSVAFDGVLVQRSCTR